MGVGSLNGGISGAPFYRRMSSEVGGACRCMRGEREDDLKALPPARRNLSSTTIFPECHTGLSVLMIHRWTASMTIVLSSSVDEETTC